jgi:hypothetical protein
MNAPLIDLVPSGAVFPIPPSSTSGSATSSSSSPSRTSIRERCGITFTLANAVGPSPLPQSLSKGHLEPRAGSLPRRTRMKPSHASQVIVVPPRKVVPSCPLSDETAAACNAPDRIELTCPQPVIPGLLVAFEEDASDGFFVKYEDRKVNKSVKLSVLDNFTHVVHISTGENHDALEESFDMVDGKQQIRLVVPMGTSDMGVTHLTAGQLLSARMFLSAAIPPSPKYASRSLTFLHECGARLLITAPRDRPVDAISVATCFLAHALGRTSEQVLTLINDEQDFSRLWQGTVSLDGAEFIEDVVRRQA